MTQARAKLVVMLVYTYMSITNTDALALPLSSQDLLDQCCFYCFVTSSLLEQRQQLLLQVMWSLGEGTTSCFNLTRDLSEVDAH